jgi:hypothetical protein
MPPTSRTSVKVVKSVNQENNLNLLAGLELLDILIA